MKVLLVNGSCNKNGCTFTALKEISDTLNKQDIETEIIQLGSSPYRDCIGCGGCRKSDEGKCVFDDDIVNTIIEKAKTSDAFVFGSPVYYPHPSGRLLSVMDRIFYAGGKFFEYKPAAAIVSARRSGTTASLDAIIKHFTINNMPVVSSNYWPMVHGSQNKPDEVKQDLEGLQIMRTLGLNMALMLKNIEAGKKAGVQKPQLEDRVLTNFIR